MESIIIELSLDGLNLCLQGLAELPFKQSAPLINELHRQYANQQQPAAPDQTNDNNQNETGASTDPEE